MATLPDWADFAWWRSSIGEGDISGKGLVEKEAMERKHSEEEVDLYDRLLSENDHDLYQWVSGQTETPAPYVDMIARIAARADGVVKI